MLPLDAMRNAWMPLPLDMLFELHKRNIVRRQRRENTSNNVILDMFVCSFV